MLSRQKAKSVSNRVEVIERGPETVIRSAGSSSPQRPEHNREDPKTCST